MVIIIPGWMHAASEWKQVSDLLHERQIEHAVLDIPGFGTVAPDPAINTLTDLCRWCAIEIDRLQRPSTSPLVLFGHSCGGRVAVQLAAEGLEVQHLILSGSPNLYRPSFKTKLVKALAALARPFKHQVPEQLRQKFRSADFAAARDTQMLTLYQSVVTGDQRDILPNIAAKTTLLWGECDEAAPLSIAQEMLPLIAGSQLAIIPHAGHNLHHEKPQLLAAKITTYVAS